MSDLTILRHRRAELALHQLRAGSRHPLLLLHGLGERSPLAVPMSAADWPGPVYALDFTGHGASTVPAGGGYTAEVLMADVDAAIAALGPSTILGRGLGAYVALLIAGGRADLVAGAVLADGPGLLGGGTGPSSIYIPPYRPPAVVAGPAADGPVAGPPTDGPVLDGPVPDAPAGAGLAAPDPFALAELSHDVRPADYAVEYVRMAVAGSSLDEPITVAAVVRPDWLAAVVDQPGVAEASVAAALASYA